MPALTLQAKLINLSYAYDALTVYPKYQVFETDTGNEPLLLGVHLVKTACNKLAYIITNESESTPTKESKQESEACQELEEKNSEFQRHVHANEPDHKFYHQDNFSENDSHFHVKFKHMLNRAQISQILGIFVTHELLSKDEHDDFLKKFDQRYLENQAALDKTLHHETAEDTKAIFNFIDQCPDNDILANLHEYLETEKFNYLREITDAMKNSRHQGIDHTGHIVKTSIFWTKIEKAFELKMATNVCKEVSSFSKKVARERAEQLKQSHPFFAIKREDKFSFWRRNNATFNAFANGDEKALTTKYEKHFREVRAQR